MNDNKNVIDLSQRRNKAGKGIEVGSLNLKLEGDQVRAVIATALASVIFLVTLANNSLLSAEDVGESSLSSRVPASERGMASVPTGTSDWEDRMVTRLSKLSISQEVQLGRRPSELERLTLEFLEGKYAVRLENGKIRELNFSDSSQTGDSPKYVTDRRAFLDQNRALLPVAYTQTVKSETKRDQEQVIESYDLVDEKATVAKVEFRMDRAGRLISMKID